MIKIQVKELVSGMILYAEKEIPEEDYDSYLRNNPEELICLIDKLRDELNSLRFRL